VKAHDLFLLPAWVGSDPRPYCTHPLGRWAEFNAACGLSHHGISSRHSRTLSASVTRELRAGCAPIEKSRYLFLAFAM
jgi:hypothetical protein